MLNYTEVKIGSWVYGLEFDRNYDYKYFIDGQVSFIDVNGNVYLTNIPNYHNNKRKQLQNTITVFNLFTDKLDVHVVGKSEGYEQKLHTELNHNVNHLSAFDYDKVWLINELVNNNRLNDLQSLADELDCTLFELPSNVLYNMI